MTGILQKVIEVRVEYQLYHAPRKAYDCTCRVDR